MAYTPEMSMESSRILRRLAWTLGKPMTKTMEFVMQNITLFINPKKICAKCKDKSICQKCIFNEQNHKSCNQVFQ